MYLALMVWTRSGELVGKIQGATRCQLQQSSAQTGVMKARGKLPIIWQQIRILLRAFKGMTLTVVQLPGQTIRHITSLSDLQWRILELLDLPSSIYENLALQAMAHPP